VPRNPLNAFQLSLAFNVEANGLQLDIGVHGIDLLRLRSFPRIALTDGFSGRTSILRTAMVERIRAIA